MSLAWLLPHDFQHTFKGTSLNKVQENLMREGLVRLAASGRRTRTRRITSIREYDSPWSSIRA